MALPLNTATVLSAAYPAAVPLVDYECIRKVADGPVEIETWNESLGPQPTEQQVNDWATDAAALPSGQTFSEWEAEHGGDVLATAKRKIREALDSDADLTRAGFQALILLLLDNIVDAAWQGGSAPSQAAAWNAFKAKVADIQGE